MPNSAVAPELLSLEPLEVEATLRKVYHLEAKELRSMPSELATVSRVETSDGRTLAFKASRFTDAELAITGWRTEAMEHLQSLGIPVGRTIPSVNGELLTVLEHPSKPAIIHLGEWLAGTPLDSTVPATELLNNVGRVAADISRGLAEHPKPPAPIAHPWELTRSLESLAASMPSAADSSIRTMLQTASDRFAQRVASKLASLPHQVVHHDLHDSNLLVTGNEITGVLDFGDMVWAPRVAELVVAGAYASRRSPTPVAALLDVVAGWGALVPLSEDEASVIFDSAAARLAVNLSVWTARMASDRGDYAAARSAGVVPVLDAYLSADREATLAGIRERLR
ncbi:MAG: phosphotransferase [Gulosibacter sp.]|uniref:phosphotransferase n=1 Tax=Gulosibacter sp. TaxID=2817531 RepID=UPI003F92CF1C